MSSTRSEEVNERNTGIQVLQAAALGTVIVANVLLFTPSTLYSGNQNEFSTSIADILGTFFIPGIIAIIVLGILGGLMANRSFARYISLLAALPLLMWLQGAILVWDYGVLDGSPIPWLATGWRGVLDTTIWVGVFLIAIYASQQSRKFLIYAVSVTTVIQLAILANQWASGSFEASSLSDRTYDLQEYQSMFRFSSRKNVFHVVMDGFQSDIFADIIRDPEQRALADTLSGFTFFEENTGTFPYTEMSVPLLMSGNRYYNHMPAEEFINATMRGETILNAAAGAGYDVDIASQVALRNVYTKGSYTNSYSIPINLHASVRDYRIADAAKLLDLSLFRLAPHFVKAYIYQDEFWFVQRYTRDEAYLQIRYFADLEFLRQISDKLVADRIAPVYKLFHVMLSHRPTVGNDNCEYDGRNPTTRTHVIVQARCGLSHVVDILERMKKAGIYDSSLIILMADHGAWIPPKGYVPEKISGASGPSPIMAGMAVPTLAVKPPGARGPLRVSSVPTTIGDVPKTIALLMDIDADFGGGGGGGTPSHSQSMKNVNELILRSPTARTNDAQTTCTRCLNMRLMVARSTMHHGNDWNYTNPKLTANNCIRLSKTTKIPSVRKSAFVDFIGLLTAGLSSYR